MGDHKPGGAAQRPQLMIYKSAVIGLGNIGQGYDYSFKDDSIVLTHAKAFAQHSGFDLIGGIDPDPEARHKFFEKYGKSAFSSVTELSRHVVPAVVSISVPDHLHHAVLSEVLSFSPTIVLCEKPLATDVATAKRMLLLAKQAGCALAVNYSRRFEPGVIELRRMIKDDEFGELFKGTVWYSKGLLNNASHFIDLAVFLLGNAEDIQILSNGRTLANGDHEPDFKLRIGTCEIYFLSARDEHYTLNSLELLGTAGRIRYEQGGLAIRYCKTTASELFPEYTVLSEEILNIKNDMKRIQIHVLDAIHDFLANGTPLNSDGESALQTLEIVNKIVESRGRHV